MAGRCMDRLTHLNKWCSVLVDEYRDCSFRGGYYWQEMAVIHDLAKVFSPEVIATKLGISLSDVESALDFRRKREALGLAS